MKKFVSTSLFALVFSTCSWSQIPDPVYIPSEYKDTTLNESFSTTANNDSLLTLKNEAKKNKLQPKLYIGFGNFNFIGDISDTRNTGIIGQSGFQIGLTTNINEFIDASLLMEEGIVRVDGINQVNFPTNFKSTINTIGLRFDYNFKNIFENKLLTPYLGIGISYLKFDSKGSYDNTNNEYEVDLLNQWLLDPINTEPYSQNAVDIPLSIGLNLKINDRFNFKVGTTYHYTNTDYIDNILDGNTDKYFVNTAHIIYDLRCFDCEEKYIPEIKDDYFVVDFNALDKEDEDKDGVIDIDDFCIGTPKDVKVDAKGCPIDTDNDNIPDYLDKEANTPKGAVVNSDGIQLTDEMSEAIYLSYLNSASRKDANSYFKDTYPSDKFIKLTKKVVNIEGDTLLVDIYKPRLFQQIFNQQKEFENSITAAKYFDLNSDIIYKLEIGKFADGIEASEINKLMSIKNLKSTLSNDFTIYYLGEYKDVLKARQKQKQLINSGYENTMVIEDNQGDLRTISNEEMDEERNRRASKKLEDLPLLENVIFRVQLDVLKEVDLDYYDLDDIIPFPGKNGLFHIVTEGYDTYEEALERRNELYFMSYENSNVIAIKGGEIVDAKDYMDLSQSKEKVNVYGDVIFKVQLGIYSKNDKAELIKVNELEGVEKTEISEGINRYTIGTYTSIQGAMLKLNKLTNQGYKGSYIISFYEGKQISIKKAKQLIGF
ncbi:outer membrane beta-barrel protein [Flavobacteriales bacterium]|nr:outer membrane beta-barrel protein [Flavobacteriales bacterium]